MNSDPTSNPYLACDDVLQDLYARFGRAVLIPVEKHRTVPPDDQWKGVTYAQTQTAAYMRGLSKSNIVIACGGVSENLCAIIFAKEAAMERYFDQNPKLAETLVMRGFDRWVIWLRIIGFCPPTQVLGSYTWQGDGSTVLIHNRDVFGEQLEFSGGPKPTELEFQDLIWEDPARATFQLQIVMGLHGPPELPDNNGRLRPNHNFWASYFSEKTDLKYHPGLKQFVRRKNPGQKWVSVPTEIVKQEAYRLVFDFGRANGWEMVRLPFTARDMTMLLSTMEYIAADSFADEPDGLVIFLDRQVEKAPGTDSTTEELFQAYRCFCQNEHLPALTEREFQRRLPANMKSKFGVCGSHSLVREQGDKRGYSNVRLRCPEVVGAARTAGTAGTPAGARQTAVSYDSPLE